MTIGFAGTLQRLKLKYELYVMILLVVFGTLCRILGFDEMFIYSKECKLFIFLLSMLNILTSCFSFVWYAQTNVMVKRWWPRTHIVMFSVEVEIKTNKRRSAAIVTQ